MSDFATIQHIIRNRRSARTADMNGKKIPDKLIRDLLEMADWAPTHARTEPWRFLVYSGEACRQFCTEHAGLYQSHTPGEQFNQAKHDKLQHQGDQISHLITVYMQRTEPPKLPLIEEIAATAAAIQNILLGAEAAGISVLWSTGGMTHHPAMKAHLGLQEHDQMMGLLYLGYTDQAVYPAKRNITLAEKVRWYS
ncbi:MAG TPA: nitroreductase [Sediminibacterium sp.]|nr:nitroreductase [Sediminibacterium sp.]